MDERHLEGHLRTRPPDEGVYPGGALAGADVRRATVRLDIGQQRARLAPVALLAAAIAIIAAVGWVLVPASSPRTGATVVPSAAASLGRSVVTPASLVDRWVGPVRTIAGLEVPVTRAVLDIRGSALRLDVGQGLPHDVFDSSVHIREPDTMELIANGRTGGCQPFDRGTYRWSLSSSGSDLTLDLIEDACGARGAALPGDWVHTACREAGSDCLGPVDAGSYRSTDFDPFGTGRAGQIRFDLPSGWADTIDHPQNYFLRPAVDYLADPGFDGNDTVHGIYLWAATVVAAQTADCSGVEADGVERRADAIADHLLSADGLVVTDLGAIDLGGRRGRMLDLELDPAWSATCPWSDDAPFHPVIANGDLGPAGGVWGLDGDGRQRLILVDVAPQRVASIWIDTTRDRFEALAAEAMPIVRSIRFDPGTTSP